MNHQPAPPHSALAVLQTEPLQAATGALQVRSTTPAAASPACLRREISAHRRSAPAHLGSFRAPNQQDARMAGDHLAPPPINHADPLDPSILLPHQVEGDQPAMATRLVTPLDGDPAGQPAQAGKGQQEEGKAGKMKSSAGWDQKMRGPAEVFLRRWTCLAQVARAREEHLPSATEVARSAVGRDRMTTTMRTGPPAGAHSPRQAKEGPADHLALGGQGKGRQREPPRGMLAGSLRPPPVNPPIPCVPGCWYPCCC